VAGQRLRLPGLAGGRRADAAGLRRPDRRRGADLGGMLAARAGRLGPPGPAVRRDDGPLRAALRDALERVPGRGHALRPVRQRAAAGRRVCRPRMTEVRPMTEAGWSACDDPRPLLEHLGGAVDARKFRLFVLACCHRLWDDRTDDLSRLALALA